jgi:hypothetical protein
MPLTERGGHLELPGSTAHPAQAYILRPVILGFSGHRKLRKSADVAKLIATVIDTVKARCGAITAVSSAAAGADTLFLEAACNAGIPFSVILPFPVGRFRKDFEPDEWRRIEPLLSRAVRVVELSGAATDTDAYLAASIAVVDAASVLLAVFDPNHPSKKGGTRDAVDYAHQQAKPVILIDPIAGTVDQRQWLRDRPAPGASGEKEHS